MAILIQDTIFDRFPIMTNQIKFVATSEYGFEVALRPIPASQAIPDWWKKMPPYMPSVFSEEGKVFNVENGLGNNSPKKCVPMLDAITSGYVLPLWADVQIDSINYEVPRFTWKTREAVFETHVSVDKVGLQYPENYSPMAFKYLNPWKVVTPKGYSILVTHPFGYSDVPLRALDAVIDSDKSSIELVPPVWVKKGFRGTIEKGTPIAQIIPFKRESWESSFDFVTEEQNRRLQDKQFNGTFIGHYIKNHWSKKEYK